jgi:hypothetical protein
MRLKVLSAVLLALVVGALGAGSPAFAAPAKPAVATEQRKVINAADGVWYCSPLTNGSLCIRYVNNFTGIDVHYEKRAGGKIIVRFKYASHTNGTLSQPSAWGDEYAGGLNSAIWNNASNVSDCMQGVMESKPSENGTISTYYTPIISKGHTACAGW